MPALLSSVIVTRELILMVESKWKLSRLSENDRNAFESSVPVIVVVHLVFVFIQGLLVDEKDLISSSTPELPSPVADVSAAKADFYGDGSIKILNITKTADPLVG